MFSKRSSRTAVLGAPAWVSRLEWRSLPVECPSTLHGPQVGTVLLLDEAVTALSRCWCLLDIFLPVELSTTQGPVPGDLGVWEVPTPLGCT